MGKRSLLASRWLKYSAATGMLCLGLLLGVPKMAHAGGSGKTAKEALQTINALYEDLSYEEALGQVQLAREGPRTKREEMLLSLYEGILLCELSKPAQAEKSFRAALLVRQDLNLPVVVAPKIEQLFESVRQSVRAELAAHTASAQSKGSEARVPATATANSQLAPDVSTPSAPAQLREQPPDREPPAASGESLKSRRPRSFGIKTRDSTNCQPTVHETCERLMKRLLHIQEQYLRANPDERLPAVRELVITGQQLRSARTVPELQEAMANLDYWQGLYMRKSD